MSELSELLSLEPCDCGRSWCNYFAPRMGEWGTSYSRADVEEMASELPKLQRHLETLLNKDGFPSAEPTDVNPSIYRGTHATS